MRFCYCALPAMNPGIDVCRNCGNNTENQISRFNPKTNPNFKFDYVPTKEYGIPEEWNDLFFDKEVIEKYNEDGKLIEKITKYVKRGK